MPLPILVPVAISAIKALLRFRDRVDIILSLNEATAGLPFALPDPPTDTAPHLNAMLSFYTSDHGQLLLQLHGLQDDFAMVSQNPTAISPSIAAARSRLFKLYFMAADVQPLVLGPNDSPAQVVATKGLSTEMRLAYYVVQSQRLSRNTALVRVLLATADTLLEFAGENAHVFISHPQTRSLVADLIDEFAGKRDFDDEGIETIFKSLLGSTVLALVNNPGTLANKPALSVLFAALGDVRDSLGNDFVARIISVDGFEQLIAACATEVAQDPSFITKSALAQQVLTATLTHIGKNFPQIAADPQALLGVLVVGLGTAANVTGILERELAGEPLLAAGLSVVLKRVGTLAQSNQRIADIANGQMIAEIYKTTLLAIAANPITLANPSEVEKFVSDLVVGLANALSQQELSQLFTPDTLKLLAAKSLTVLSGDPHFLAGHNQFATQLLTAVFQASATALSDGLTTNDLLDIATAAIKAASDNMALLNLDAQLAAAITSIGEAVAAAGFQQRLNPSGRKAVLLTVLHAVAASPTVWGQLQNKELIQPLIQAVLQGLATDPTQLLSGPVLVDAVRRTLLAAGRRGRQLVEQKVTTDDVQQLLTMALHRAKQEIGTNIDGENLPVFLEHVMADCLNASLKLPDGQVVDFEPLIDAVVRGLGRVNQS